MTRVVTEQACSKYLPLDLQGFNRQHIIWAPSLLRCLNLLVTNFPRFSLNLLVCGSSFWVSRHDPGKNPQLTVLVIIIMCIKLSFRQCCFLSSFRRMSLSLPTWRMYDRSLHWSLLFKKNLRSRKVKQYVTWILFLLASKIIPNDSLLIFTPLWVFLTSIE